MIKQSLLGSCLIAVVLVTDIPDYSVRLVVGNHTLLKYGRVEVYIIGQWRAVCGDVFDDNAAKVVCRQLGYSGRASYDLVPYIESSTRAILLEKWRCIGHERSLEHCNHNAVGIHDCNRDVTVFCGRREDVPDYSVRLVGGYSTRGRVEVFILGHWRTVCDDSFTSEAATVVCRQLGYSGHAGIDQSYYARTSNKGVLVDGVRCFGDESSLRYCKHNFPGTNGCARFDGVAVHCDIREVTSVVPYYSVRLGGGTRTRGRVEVFIDGHWGSVCGDGFTKKAARIVCSELGYSGYAIIDNSYGSPTTTVVLYKARCVGHENSLRYCNFVLMGPNDCTSSNVVAVDCQNKRATIASILGPVVGCLAGVVILTMIGCYCRKKSKNRARERHVRSQDGRQSQSLHYSLNVQYNNSTGTLQMEPFGPRRVIDPPSSPGGPRRVIVPPASPGVYDGPPSYDKLFPNVVTPVPKSTDDSSPPPYPGTTSSAVFTVPTGSTSTPPPYPGTTSPAQ